MLHQAAFTASRIILVKNAFLGGFIQFTDGDLNCLYAGGLLTAIQRQTRLGNKGASPPAINTITDTLLFVLPIALDLRFNVCQVDPPKKFLAYDNEG